MLGGLSRVFCFPCWPQQDNSSINSERTSMDEFDGEVESSCCDCFPKDGGQIKNAQDEYVVSLLANREGSSDEEPEIKNGYLEKERKIPQAPYYFDPSL